MKHAYVATKQMYVDQHRLDCHVTAKQAYVQDQGYAQTLSEPKKVPVVVDVVPLIVRRNPDSGVALR